MGQNACLVAALEYAEAGYRVLPCRPNAKIPAIKDWVNVATTDRKQIETWWRTHMDANVGIATGRGSDALVIDIDVKNDVDGRSTLQSLQATHGELPSTLTARTPSGGEHRIFRYPQDLAVVSRTNVADGVDIRADGAQIVAAPSHIDAGRYEWINQGSERAVLPMPWFEFLMSKHRDFPEHIADDHHTIPEGRRNDTLFRHACFLRDRGLSIEDAEVVILNKASSCSPPLPAAEALACLNSAYNYSPNVIRRLSDYGNAERLIDRCAPEIRYLPELAVWLVREGPHWRISNLGEVERHAKATVRAINKEAEAMSDPAPLRKHALRSESRNAIANMLELAKSESGVSLNASILDAQPYLFGVANGVIDLETATLTEVRADTYVTMASNFEFDPNATCPRWEQFISEVMEEDAEVANFMQRIVGYTLTAGNHEQVFIILHGLGANGKSTFLAVLQQLLGTYARAVDNSLFMRKNFANSSGPREDIVRLARVRAIYTNEVGDGEVLDEEFVKRITGQDPLVGRVPYGKSSIEFIPMFTPWMAANNKPIIRGEDHGIWRRIMLIPFKMTFSPQTRERNLATRLAAEGPGILNWALAGFRAYQNEGMNVPQAIWDATRDYRTQLDPLADWIDEKCVMDPKAWTASRDLYEDFLIWSGLDSCRWMNSRVFGRKLAAKGFESLKKSGKRGFAGIQVASRC